MVSIHAPTRGATRTEAADVRKQMFRSTPPREGRPYSGHSGGIVQWFRSTPPREGRRAGVDGGLDAVRVSIHAPTRGATALAGITSIDMDAGGFDPRPHARGDLEIQTACNPVIGFRSTPPREGRRRT